jgi:hypothetical protein
MLPFSSALRALCEPTCAACLLLVLSSCGSTPKTDTPEPVGPTSQVAGRNVSEPAKPMPAAPPANEAAAVPSAPSDIEAALAYDDADPLGDLEAADALDRMGKMEPLPNTAAPKGSCVVLDPGRRVWQTPGPVAIAALERGFAVAGYARKGEAGEQLFLVSVPASGLPEPIASLELKPPQTAKRIAPPGLAMRTQNDVVVAFTDGNGALRARRMRMALAGHGASIELAKGVDTRFSPALITSQDRTLVAYTLGTTPMRTMLATLAGDGSVEDKRDVTPVSMGASAPSFVSGAEPPVLLMLDARDGMSPLLRLDLSADGSSSEPAQVVVPVSMVASPPELAAASSSIGTHVVYTGVGSAATTAVGLVSIAPIVGAPEALVPGTSYGQLHTSATAAPRAVIVVATAPLTPTKDPELELQVSVVGVAGRGPAVVIRGAGGASHPAIARDDAGYVAVAYTTPSGVFVAFLRCDDGGV